MIVKFPRKRKFGEHSLPYDLNVKTESSVPFPFFSNWLIFAFFPRQSCWSVVLTFCRHSLLPKQRIILNIISLPSTFMRWWLSFQHVLFYSIWLSFLHQGDNHILCVHCCRSCRDAKPSVVRPTSRRSTSDRKGRSDRVVLQICSYLLIGFISFTAHMVLTWYHPRVNTYILKSKVRLFMPSSLTIHSNPIFFLWYRT